MRTLALKPRTYSALLQVSPPCKLDEKAKEVEISLNTLYDSYHSKKYRKRVQLPGRILPLGGNLRQNVE